MFDNDTSDSERVGQRSNLWMLLSANIVTFLVITALVNAFELSLAKPITLIWVLTLVIHAMIGGSLDSRRKMRQTEIERELQAGYDLEKPKRRLMLGDDGELVSDLERLTDGREKSKRVSPTK